MEPVPSLWLAACTIIFTILFNQASRMYFGNIRRIGCPWRAAICATMRVPSETYPVPSGSAGWAGLRSTATNPSAWVSLPNFDIQRRGTPQLAIAILALALFALLAAGAVSGYLVYRMISPARSHSEIDLQNFPGHPEKLNFTVSGEGPRDGWFFPGLKTAPTIVLCPALRIQPRRTPHAGFGVAGSAVQRAGL